MSNHKTSEIKIITNNNITKLNEKIDKALEFAMGSSIDRPDNKQWIIDQMVRTLLDSTEKEEKTVICDEKEIKFKVRDKSTKYKAWVKKFQKGEDGNGTFVWDEGTEPNA